LFELPVGMEKGIVGLGVVPAFGAPALRKRAVAPLLVAPMLLCFGLAPSSTESASANGDTRSLSFTDGHTNESGTFTYMVDGVYDQPTLDKLNWFMRDWRLNESAKMDPKLFDIVWEVYRESGSKQPIDVLSGYRSPQTNALLRRRSRQVAKYSQHMEGKAIDAHFIDVDTATIRDIAMRMEQGGVGFYPNSYTPWVHIDSGDIRYWPRMNRNALARIFPDGKTVFYPSDGQPMAGYDQAKAEIEARGGEVATAQASNTGSGGVFSWLFGAHAGGADDAEEASGDEVAPVGRNARASGVATAQADTAPSATIAAAQRNLPPGQTALQQGPLQPDAADADASAVTLTGPIAAEFIAPLPPPKPIEMALADAPTPPTRPTELAFASPSPASTSAADSDLIAALLAVGQLLGVIARGVDAPRGLLALAEVDPPEPPERPAVLARAAALSAPLPPLPLGRPATRALAKAISNETTATIPAHSFALNAGKPANPYGGLITDGFAAESADASQMTAAVAR
jgi:uncharacterized protein YcbK (DUF882 family)